MTKQAKPPTKFVFRRRTTVPGIARELLRCFEDPQRWVRVWQAQDKYETPVDPRSRTAVCWCVEGAATAAASNSTSRRSFEQAFLKVADRPFMWAVNDGPGGLPAVRRVLRKLAKGSRRHA